MSISALQKGSLAILLWFLLYFLASFVVYRSVWPAERRAAAVRAGTLAADAPPPLPWLPAITIYALPTIVAGGLTLLYRVGARRSARRPAGFPSRGK
ncbi:MAG TPA: hypothetical protein VHD76_21540 [Bryobacteraceae bacterium]|jgi:hypothetical protein|nr:hypothetical protein [Bryobacteraceae bacterium]